MPGRHAALDRWSLTMSTESNSGTGDLAGGGKRTRMVRPYPIHSLEDALTVAGAIQESNAGLPFERTLLARELGTTPASSGYTMRLNSSTKYGLTQGGYNDNLISLTPRGEGIVAPKGNDELREALVEAATQPDVFERFYRMLDGKRLPEDTYAQNMLHRELGVHPDLTTECLGIIKANGLYIGVLKEAEGSLEVVLKEVREPASGGDGVSSPSAGVITQVGSRDDAPARGRIFIGHGGRPEAVQALREIFDEFEIPYGSAEGDGRDAQPVPASVSAEMRDCTAAVLVLAGEDEAEASGGQGPAEWMLYLLGAASVLYGDRIVIVREAGLEPAQDVAGLRSVEFDPREPRKAGLDLLVELRRAGVIKVVA